MAYTAGDVRLANAALALLAETSLTSFSDPPDLGGKVEAIYAPTVRYHLSSYPWRFTLSKQQLSRLGTAPNSEWTYQHQMPPNALMLRALRPSGQPGVDTVTDFEIFGDKVLSNTLDLWADYQIERAPEFFPAPFYKMVTHALAGDLAVLVTGSTSLAEHHLAMAMGTPREGGNGGLTATARRADSQQQPPQRLRRHSLLLAHQGGRFG